MKRSNFFKIAILPGLPVCFILVAARLIWGIPKPLMLYLAATYAVAALLFWLGLRRRPARLWQASALLITWPAAAAAILALVYQVDRSGWYWLRVTGYELTRAEYRPIKPMRLPDSFAVRGDSIVVRAGMHRIAETVVIPGGHAVRIAPGARLRFGPGCSLISYSPITARGTAAAPIVFTAAHRLLKWGVVGVVGSGRSVFEHVVFEHARLARVNGQDFMAGLSILGGEVVIEHSRFENMYGKDAVNVRNGRVRIRGNLFRNTYKDGLDLDAGTGEISGNQFINCGDEGIDLSENKDVQVFGNEIRDTRGGRIAAENNLTEIVSLNTLGYLRAN